MIKERNFGKCDSVSSASSRRALEHIVPGGHREVLQWDRVRVKRLSIFTEVPYNQTTPHHENVETAGTPLFRPKFRLRNVSNRARMLPQKCPASPTTPFQWPIPILNAYKCKNKMF